MKNLPTTPDCKFHRPARNFVLVSHGYISARTRDYKSAPAGGIVYFIRIIYFRLHQNLVLHHQLNTLFYNLDRISNIQSNMSDLL